MIYNTLIYASEYNWYLVLDLVEKKDMKTDLRGIGFKLKVFLNFKFNSSQPKPMSSLSIDRLNDCSYYLNHLYSYQTKFDANVLLVDPCKMYNSADKRNPMKRIFHQYNTTELSRKIKAEGNQTSTAIPRSEWLQNFLYFLSVGDSYSWIKGLFLQNWSAFSEGQH